jgi:hypothetical protein
VGHSPRYTCSTAKSGCVARESRSCRRPANIPTCGTRRLAVHGGGISLTPVRTSLPATGRESVVEGLLVQTVFRASIGDTLPGWTPPTQSETDCDSKQSCSLRGPLVQTERSGYESRVVCEDWSCTFEISSRSSKDGNASRLVSRWTAFTMCSGSVTKR